VLWTGLDGNSVAAYGDCLRALAVTQRKAIALIFEAATRTEVTFRVVYTPSGAMPNPVKVKWSGAAAQHSGNLPNRLIADTQLVVVERPKVGGDDEQLIVNAEAAGDGDAVVVTALPNALSEDEKRASKCLITETPDPLPSFGVPGAASWVCPLPTRGGQYRVLASIKPTADQAVRANYVLALVVSKPDGSSESVNITEANQMDTVEGPNLLSPTFHNNGGIYSLPPGRITVRVDVEYAANHCCFDKSNGRDGVFTMPKAVDISLERLTP